jgi:hypothetical protein
MPVLPSISQADMAAVLNDVRYDQNLWVPWFQVLAGHVDLEFSETAAEGDLLLLCESLVPNHDDAALVEHVFDRAKGSMVKRLREVQPSDLGSQ